jgi:hypothetical protein
MIPVIAAVIKNSKNVVENKGFLSSILYEVEFKSYHLKNLI